MDSIISLYVNGTSRKQQWASPSGGILRELVVMLQELSNATATLNRHAVNLLRPVRDFAPSYFNDVSVHSRDMNRQEDVEVHQIHVRKVLTPMREHKLYDNLKKCI